MIGAMVVVIMGVSGVGKTTVGQALARALGWTFHDADALHAPDAVEQMRRGEPLTDVQRQPWLQRVRATIEEALAAGRDIVIACSALREEYRQQLLADDPQVYFVFLDANPAIIRDRLVRRGGHFAGTALLDSQLDTLERPAGVLTLNAALPVESLVSAIKSRIS
jgi:carbohydrate kinase (thermoresistant glucokinase family)